MSSDPHVPAKVKPVVVALLTADGIHKDPAGKHYILGVFNRISSRRFPTTHRPFDIYLALTDGYGTASLEIRLVEAGNERVALWKAAIDVNFRSPLDMPEISLPVPAVTFPQPGEYQLQVVSDGEILFERRINVRPASDSRRA
jgi:hypothetical protein